MSDFLAYGLKFLAQDIGPALEGYFDGTEEIDSFKELFDMFEGGLRLPPQVLDAIRKSMPLELLKEIFRSDGENFPKFPKPHIIKGTAAGLYLISAANNLALTVSLYVDEIPHLFFRLLFYFI